MKKIFFIFLTATFFGLSAPSSASSQLLYDVRMNKSNICYRRISDYDWSGYDRRWSYTTIRLKDLPYGSGYSRNGSLERKYLRSGKIKKIICRD